MDLTAFNHISELNSYPQKERMYHLLLYKIVKISLVALIILPRKEQESLEIDKFFRL
jgi:hypothetical protein